MKQLRSTRHLIKLWHRRHRAATVRVAGAVPPAASGTGRSAFTATGLAVEDQVRKARRPGMLGLALF